MIFRFMSLLKKEGFAIQADKIGDKVFVKLHCSFKRLCVEAENVNIEMPLKQVIIFEFKS